MEEGGNTTQQDTKGDAFVASKENSISGYESDLINLVLRVSRAVRNQISCTEQSNRLQYEATLIQQTHLVRNRFS